jgi:tetratricopeptide (TPR) repeat protein
MEKVAAYRHACTPAYAEVRKLLDRALAIRKSKKGPDHPGIADILNKLALLSLAEGNLAEARSLCEKALEMRERVLDPSDTEIGQSHRNLGRILLDLGDNDAARNHCIRALSIFEAAHGRLHPDVATTLTILGHIDENDLSLTQMISVF